MKQPVSIFCAAAPQDHTWLTRWEKHLWPLQQSRRVTIWSEAYITSGVSRDQWIEEYLSTTEIVVFLLSSDFFADHKYFTVLTNVLNRAPQGRVRIIPLLLRATALDETVLSGIAYLPTNGRPVVSWRNHDDAFQNCVDGLKKVLVELQSNDKGSRDGSDNLLCVRNHKNTIQ